MKLYDEKDKGKIAANIVGGTLLLFTANVCRGLFNGTFRRKSSRRCRCRRR